MAIDVDFRTQYLSTQQLSSRCEDRHTKTHVGSRLSCCNEESIEVLGLQSGVGGDQQRPQLAHKAQIGTAIPSGEDSVLSRLPSSKPIIPPRLTVEIRP